MWFLRNFRRGFATNSSSSHSFVYLKQPATNYDDVSRPLPSNEFGWEDFSLSRVIDKLFYVLVGRVGNVGWNQDASLTDEKVQEIQEEFPMFTADEIRYARKGYIDHDSLGIIGKDLAEDPTVVLFGGNDNTYDDIPSHMRVKWVKSGTIDWSRTEPIIPDFDAATDEDKPTVREAYIAAQGWDPFGED